MLQNEEIFQSGLPETLGKLKVESAKNVSFVVYTFQDQIFDRRHILFPIVSKFFGDFQIRFRVEKGKFWPQLFSDG